MDRFEHRVDGVLDEMEGCEWKNLGVWRDHII